MLLKVTITQIFFLSHQIPSVTEDDMQEYPQCSFQVRPMGGTAQQNSVIEGPDRNNLQEEGLVWLMISEHTCLFICPCAEHHRTMLWRAAMHILVGRKQGTRPDVAKDSISTGPTPHYLLSPAKCHLPKFSEPSKIVFPAGDKVFIT